MAREAWPKTDVIESSKRAVFLAVFRWARDEDKVTTPSDGGGKAKSGSTKDSEWAIRLDVMGYPQVRLLDGWGRALASSDRYANLRTGAQVVEAVDAAIRDAKQSKEAYAPVSPSKALLDRFPGVDRDEASRPEPWRRARAWLRALEKGKHSAADLARLWDAEDDAVLRKAILGMLAPGEKDAVAARLLAEGLGGANDYVRGAAIEASVKVGGDAGAKSLLSVLEKALSGKAGWKNPNNVLCAVTSAASRLPDVRFIDPLAKVVEKHDANNTATLNAVEALIAIGKADGMPKVKAALLAARDRPGAHQKRIQSLVDSALGK